MQLNVTNKEIIKLALPISLALIIPQLSFFTNTVFLGRLGERELAVNGVCGIYYLILQMVGYGLSNGIQVQMSRRAGEGDKLGLTALLGNGLMLSFLLSVILMVLSFLLVPVLFKYTMHDSEHYIMGVAFLKIRMWGLPFLMLSQVLNGFFITIQQSKYLILGSVLATAANIIFDYGLIFGHFHFTALGINGAAWASVITDFVFFLAMFAVFFIKDFHIRYPLRKHLHLRLSASFKTLNVSAPLIGQFLFSVGGWQIFFIFVEHLGQTELAASNVLRSVYGIMGISTWAFGAAGNTLVSNLIGQNKEMEVPGAIIKVAKISFLLTLAIAVFLLVFGHEFIALYRSDPALVAVAIPSLRVIALATLLMSCSTVAFNGVLGTGNTRMNLLMEATAVTLYLIYCYELIEVLRRPLWVAWLSEFIYWSILLLLSVLYLRSGRWKGKKI